MDLFCHWGENFPLLWWERRDKLMFMCPGEAECTLGNDVENYSTEKNQFILLCSIIISFSTIPQQNVPYRNVWAWASILRESLCLAEISDGVTQGVLARGMSHSWNCDNYYHAIFIFHCDFWSKLVFHAAKWLVTAKAFLQGILKMAFSLSQHLCKALLLLGLPNALVKTSEIMLLLYSPVALFILHV